MSELPGVYLLNSSFIILNLVSPERAFNLLFTKKAWTMTVVPEKFAHSPSSVIPWPRHIVLNKYAKVPHKAPKPGSDIFATRMGVLKRDNRTCGYCGGVATTWDHIHPQSKGGPDTWENTISACRPCNAKKGNKSLEQVGMKLLWPPKAPGAQFKSFEKEQAYVYKLLSSPSGEQLTQENV